jgi:hypothetical protein
MEETYRQPTTGWVGWIVFAAVVMVINGSIVAIQGLAGILRDESFFTTAGGEVLVLDYTSWGWIHLIFGVLLAVVGVLLFKGSLVATALAIVLVALNLVSQFAWIGVYPWWSLIVILLDIFILYALIVHGGEMAD